jgi:hypothetical protein
MSDQNPEKYLESGPEALSIARDRKNIISIAENLLENVEYIRIRELEHRAQIARKIAEKKRFEAPELETTPTDPVQPETIAKVTDLESIRQQVEAAGGESTPVSFDEDTYDQIPA